MAERPVDARTDLGMKRTGLYDWKQVKLFW